jgi:hypothetical protein
MVRLKIKIKLIWTKSKTELDWTELNCFKIALQPLFVCMSVKPMKMKMNHKKTKESHHLTEKKEMFVNLWIAICERETNKQTRQFKGPFGMKERGRKENCGNQCMNID